MTLSARYREALTFAFDLHKEQERKGSGVPYVAHLLGVSSLVLEQGADEDEAIAALLHDAVEDQGGAATLRTIEARFGARVAAIVSGCTDAEESPKPPWKTRKERYLDHLAAAPASVQLVAACDKLYNARAIVADYRRVGEVLWERFSGGKEGVLWYYSALAAVFTSDKPVVHELRREVEELRRLATADEAFQPGS